MRILKLCVVLGLVLAVTGTAEAITFSKSYAGPIAFDITNRESGTNYGPLFPGFYGPGMPSPLPPGAPAPGAVILPGPDGIPGTGDDVLESGWGIFRINTIFTASEDIPRVKLTENSSDILWQEGVTDGQELMGMFYGIVDIGLSTDGFSQTIETSGFHLKVWEQPAGTFDTMAKVAFPGIEDGPDGIPNNADDPGAGAIGMSQGSLGRTGLDAYMGIGIPGGVAAASLWLEGDADPGYLANLFAATDFTSVFKPGPAGASGQAEVFFSVVGGDMGGPAYPHLNSNYYDNSIIDGAMVLGGPDSDIRAFFNTTSSNVTNTPAAPGTPYTDTNGNQLPTSGDWTVTSSDLTAGIYVVPEPMTMLAVVGFISLVPYIRKRRV